MHWVSRAQKGIVGHRYYERGKRMAALMEGWVIEMEWVKGGSYNTKGVWKKHRETLYFISL